MKQEHILRHLKDALIFKVSYISVSDADLVRKLQKIFHFDEGGGVGN